MARLNEAAESNGWQRQEYPGSQLICLRQSSLPFNDEEDLMVCTIPFVTHDYVTKALPGSPAMQVNTSGSNEGCIE